MKAIQLETIQWRTLPDIDDVEPISDKDYTVLQELRAVILKHDYQERFGVSLLHKHFELEAGEVLMETTDVGARTSTLFPETAGLRRGEKIIETAWRFREGDTPDGATVCVSRCDYNRGHKSNHHKESR